MSHPRTPRPPAVMLPLSTAWELPIDGEFPEDPAASD
jgi:hypothetical protein